MIKKTDDKNKNMLERRSFIKKLTFSCASLLIPTAICASERNRKGEPWILKNGFVPGDHHWGMGIDVNKCIGCGRCVHACKIENGVPKEPFFFRTWVERYRIFEDNETMVDSPNGAMDGFREDTAVEKRVLRNFFVPKLCNQCGNPPCVQVCPVGATFMTEDGVILVDHEYCIGCRYCIQACPYGARFLDPRTHTAEKCTFCYHRIVKGLAPACVEACPTQTRIFGEIKEKPSPLVRFMRMHKVNVLKPSLNTEPKVFYANFDMEIR